MIHYSCRAVRALVVGIAASASIPLYAQLEAPSDRIDALENELRRLEKKLEKVSDDVKDEKKKRKKEGLFADGLETLGGEKFRLGGKVEVLLIDSENDSFAPLSANGSTENPDPHFVFQRFRLAPRVDLNRWIRIRGQLDFEPDEGRTILKEVSVSHRARPRWWFGSNVQIGLDDRFIRPNRRTKSYPLIGNAFWRDESAAITWSLSFGDANGRPADAEDRADGIDDDSGATGTEGFDSDIGGGETDAGAFDFANNWGELRLHLSVGQGYVLQDNEVGFDGAAFGNIVQDDRDLDDGLSLRELGIGLGYRRNFSELGEVSLLGFYYDDELRDRSVLYLQQDLTRRDPGGIAVAGYGDSAIRKSSRYGATFEYFLPASTLFDGVLKTRRRDGLRILSQFINAEDGALRREGWFAQASYRFSFDDLVADRYFRSIEPLFRYGRLNVNLRPDPQLPGTWDRREVTLGAILEVTGDIFFKTEYTFQSERTGAAFPAKVHNNELLVQLLLEF